MTPSGHSARRQLPAPGSELRLPSIAWPCNQQPGGTWAQGIAESTLVLLLVQHWRCNSTSLSSYGTDFLQTRTPGCWLPQQRSNIQVGDKRQGTRQVPRTPLGHIQSPAPRQTPQRVPWGKAVRSTCRARMAKQASWQVCPVPLPGISCSAGLGELKTKPLCQKPHLQASLPALLQNEPSHCVGQLAGAKDTHSHRAQGTAASLLPSSWMVSLPFLPLLPR